MEKQMQEMAQEIKRLRDAMASAKVEIDFEANADGASKILADALKIQSTQIAGVRV